jgi:hypothetical protein
MDIQNTLATNLAFLNVLITEIFKTAAATTEFHLYQNNLVPGPGTTVGDFVEANYDSYAKAVKTGWFGPLTDPVSLDYYVIPDSPLLFQDGGSTTPNTIYGWYLLDDVAGNLIACGRFDTPVVMDALGKTITLSPLIYCGGVAGPDPYED